jgi:hypothetical protein
LGFAHAGQYGIDWIDHGRVLSVIGIGDKQTAYLRLSLILGGSLLRENKNLSARTASDVEQYILPVELLAWGGSPSVIGKFKVIIIIN